jgi:3'(2'), 5'-bisphosphate nucleotidase
VLKGDMSPTTIADFGAQALICRRLAAAFPGDTIVAEEDSDALRRPTGRELLVQVAGLVRRFEPLADESAVCQWLDLGGGQPSRGRFWCLDPIDGTRGFMRGDQYAVALALVVGGRVQVGALCCPNLEIADRQAEVGVIAEAAHGGGTWLHRMDDPEASASRISVSPTSQPSAARLCLSFEVAHTSPTRAAVVAQRLGTQQAPLRMDSQAKYAVVARGQADVYLRLPARSYSECIWDHAAGALIVEEAGGRVTDARGRSLDFSAGRAMRQQWGVVASNGVLHAAVLAAIADAAA